jgi:hypothetical protein
VKRAIPSIQSQIESYPTMRWFLQTLAFLWPSPYMLAGLLLGGLGLCTGGRARVRGRIIEFYGGGRVALAS